MCHKQKIISTVTGLVLLQLQEVTCCLLCMGVMFNVHPLSVFLCFEDQEPPAPVKQMLPTWFLAPNYFINQLLLMFERLNIN